MYSSSRKTSATKVNPITSKVNSLTSKVNPITSNYIPMTSKVNPIPSRVNPITSRVKPIASKVNPITSKVNPITSKVNSLTSKVTPVTSNYISVSSKVNGSISRVNSSTSRINTTASRVNASTSRVVASASGVSTSRLNMNSHGMNPSTSRPNITASRPNPAISRVNLVTSKVNTAISNVIPTVRFYEPSSRLSDVTRKTSVDNHELLGRKSDQAKKHSLSRIEPVSCISNSSSRGLTNRVSDTKGDSRCKDIRPSIRRHSIGDISISEDSSLGVRGVRKCFVRHSESDAPPKVIVQRIHSPEHVTRRTESHVNTDSNSHPTTTSGKVYKSRYAVPELYSTLTVAKAIKEDKVDESKYLKTIPPSTLKRINKKASHQLNFSPDDQLFKGLINLDINDDVVKKPQKRVVRPKLKRHDVPNLSDYYIPEFLGEFPIQNKVTLRPIGKLKYWDGLIVNQRCLAWEEELNDCKDFEGSESDES